MLDSSRLGAASRDAAVLLALVSAGAAAQEAPAVGAPAPTGWAIRVSPPEQRPADARLGPARTLNDAYHPWQPPTSLEEWGRFARRMRESVLVSVGLWPMPERAPLQPVIHGRIERDDYTVEKVYFASLPGHYVTGSLYRPRTGGGPRAAVLCPHGHWRDGRMYDAGAEAARAQIASGAESRVAAARHPLQARMVQLARMGCVVFHYDMIGYASSRGLPHRQGFGDVAAALHLQSPMGLQTWNSIRALDFVCALPDVDPARVAVTGGSGGGTQTFVLGAIDERPAVAFPAVMVSTAMQGGCVCENAPYLRIGRNNIALAALFAPRPMAMTGANDWTIDIETKGLPELNQVYALHGHPDRVTAQCFPQFEHNYNAVARAMMYGWLDRHLQLALAEPIRERDFEPLTRAELEVFDTRHPQPDDIVDAAGVRAAWQALADARMGRLLPTTAGGAAEYQRVVGAAVRVMFGARPARVEVAPGRTETVDGVQVVRTSVGRLGAGESVPMLVLRPERHAGRAVVWVDGRGKRALFGEDGPIAAVRALLAAGVVVCAVDVFGTGEFAGAAGFRPAPVDARYPAYTSCYNRPLLAERVRDIVTAIVALPTLVADLDVVDLVGTGDAGVWALLARVVAGGRIARTLVDLRGFGFGRVTEVADPMLLPGALRYGGLGGLAAVAAPAELTLYGVDAVSEAEIGWLRRLQSVQGGWLEVFSAPLDFGQVADRLR